MDILPLNSINTGGKLFFVTSRHRTRPSDSYCSELESVELDGF